MRPALDSAGHRVPRTKPTCLLHTWRPHRWWPFALVLHLDQHQSRRNLHLQYLAKSQSTQCCQSLITHQEATIHWSSNYNGPQSPPWWVHWQHTWFVNKEKKKRKETTKRNSNKWSKAKERQRARSHEEEQVSDPLGKGNGSTHPRQNMLKQRAHTTKSAQGHEPKTHTRVPPAHMQTPLEQMHARRSLGNARQRANQALTA
jgi:hypothetical protein